MLLDYYSVFLLTLKWRSQSKEERIGGGSFLRHFKSNNMSKAKIVHCVEDNRKAPIRKHCFEFLLGL